MKTLRRKKSVATPPSEVEVVRAVTELLVSERYRVRHEVPNMGQSVDIVATRARWLTCVEAKVKNWRRAIAQCLAHEQVADFICIAIGIESVSDDLLSKVGTSGYGLILYRPSDGRCTWVRTPERNRRVWQPQRRRLVSIMREIDYAR
jgi:hypothetical protein